MKSSLIKRKTEDDEEAQAQLNGAVDLEVEETYNTRSECGGISVGKPLQREAGG
jgi:hypothetical protein